MRISKYVNRAVLYVGEWGSGRDPFGNRRGLGGLCGPLVRDFGCGVGCFPVGMVVSVVGNDGMELSFGLGTAWVPPKAGV